MYISIMALCIVIRLQSVIKSRQVTVQAQSTIAVHVCVAYCVMVYSVLGWSNILHYMLCDLLLLSLSCERDGVDLAVKEFECKGDVLAD